MSDIEERLRKLVAAELGVEAAQITREATMGEALACDHLNAVDLTMRIEEEFTISIPEDRDGDICAGTFGDLVALVESLA